jgi:YesN/AraC family two-component response regulator
MRTSQAKREVKDLLVAGYEHYSREYERQLMDAFLLKGDLPDFKNFSFDQFVLAQQPLRSAKNLIICLVAVICRYAADNGANDRRCYALSDTYINKIEEQNEVSQVYGLVTELLKDYHDLIREGRDKNYSLPVQRAIRQIDTLIYEPCSLAILAREIKLHPTYLSKLFKKEVGENISCFIRNRKMEEAKNLIANSGHSLSEIAEMLGYSSLSYFSKVFHQSAHSSPRNFARAGSNKDLS